MSTTELLNVDTVAAYLRERPHVAGPVDPQSISSVVEVGDGNLNLVFIVTDTSGNGVVVKQSLPHVRVDPSWPLTRTRTKREAVVLAAHEAVDPTHVPAMYGFDEASVALSIEDLSDHAVWRSELNEGRVHAYAARELGEYVGAVGFATSVFGTAGPERRRQVALATNPELSEITEDLVFSEPYVDHEHNSWLEANAADVAELRGDKAFVREIGLAKRRFQESTQSLMHGDLHTGSVFVKADASGESGSVRAFDSEFGTYGPTGFDLGAVWANLLIAGARAQVRGRTDDAAQLLALPVQLMGAFEQEFLRRWPDRVDPRVYGADILAETLAEIRADAAVYAAAKAVRRLVGFSKVSDIETLDEPLRAEAVRRVLRTARAVGVEQRTDADTARLTGLAASIVLA